MANYEAIRLSLLQISSKFKNISDFCKTGIRLKPQIGHKATNLIAHSQAYDLKSHKKGMIFNLENQF